MTDDKWLRYQAMKLSERKGISIEDALEQVKNDPELGKANEVFRCPDCGVEVKGKNLAAHMKKHPSGPKIKWGRIPIIKEQKKKKKRLKELAGKPETKFVSGGLPSLGKKK